MPLRCRNERFSQSCPLPERFILAEGGRVETAADRLLNRRQDVNHKPARTGALRGRFLALLPFALAILAIEPRLYADTYGYEFRPGPHVPKGFKPSPGVDASGRDLSGSAFIGMDLSNANFERCNLQRAFFAQVRFQQGPASFKGADLRYATFAESPDSPRQEGFDECDFTDALIQGMQFATQYAHLSIEQLRSTKSFKLKDLSGCQIVGGVSERKPYSYHDLQPRRVAMDFCQFDLRNATFVAGDFTESDFTDAIIMGATFFKSKITPAQIASTRRYVSDQHDYTNPFRRLVPRSAYPRLWGYGDLGFSDMDLSEWDFANADLRGARFCRVNLAGVDFTNADIRGAHFYRSLDRQQLFATMSYRTGNLVDMVFTRVDFSAVDLSRQNLTGSRFVLCDFSKADFTDSIITGTDFSACVRNPPTTEQIQSTWNYKQGRMEGIRLPEGIAEALRTDSE